MLYARMAYYQSLCYIDPVMIYICSLYIYTSMHWHLYHIEDGQFSTDIYAEKLLGNSGSIIELNDNGYTVEAYILYVDDNYIECIGNVERSFPKNYLEHNKLEAATRPSREYEYEYLVSYLNSYSQINDTTISITAKNLKEAREIFNTDYPHLKIYSIDKN